ncbi:uncharacterized protein LOC126792385 [Argentina anserina]|uniref:uncharacterized protein LOC126792385 n=1 Tax=Argentina anserina TaxID=57926 RepID=UPI0021766B8B|nr:uncharacterized protein LOC126792385 [Potentilla anserina]
MDSSTVKTVTPSGSPFWLHWRWPKISLISLRILFSTSGCFCTNQKNHVRSFTVLSAKQCTVLVASLSLFSNPIPNNFIGFQTKGGTMNLNTVSSVASSKAFTKGSWGKSRSKHPESTPRATEQMLSKVNRRSTS